MYNFMDEPGLATTLVTPQMAARAVNIIFHDNLSQPDALPEMPVLHHIDRSVKGKPVRGEEKPLDDRIEYRLLHDTPKDADGNMTLKGLIDTFQKLARGEFRSKIRAELAGLRTIATLAFCADAAEPVRKAVKAFIDTHEMEINGGERECGGRHTSTGNSGMESMQAVNAWLKGWDKTVKPTPRDPLARDAEGNQIGRR